MAGSLIPCRVSRKAGEDYEIARIYGNLASAVAIH
jgi:hypothetical protein